MLLERLVELDPDTVSERTAGPIVACRRDDSWPKALLFPRGGMMGAVVGNSVEVVCFS